MRYYDAVVIGLGGMGSAATSHLATRGVKTLGLEQFDPLHTRGSSHGESRVIRQSYFEHPNYVPLLLRAYELWTQLQSESGLDLMTITGGLMIGRPDSQTIVGSQRSALQHHLRHEMLTAKQIQERFPVLTPTSELVGLYEQNAGFVRPERCIEAHLARAEAAGADLHFGERLIDWTPSSKNSTALVRTTRDTYETSSLVLAPGAWAPKLFKLDVSLQAVRQILFWIEPLCAPEAFAPERFPIYIWECDGGVQFYGFPQHGPANDGIKVAIFYNEDPCDPERKPIDRRRIRTANSILFAEAYPLFIGANRQSNSVHVYQYSRPSLCAWEASAIPDGHHCVPLFRAWIQILQRDWRDPSGSCDDRFDASRHRYVFAHERNVNDALQWATLLVTSD